MYLTNVHYFDTKSEEHFYIDNPVLITVSLLQFKFEDKKSFRRRLSLNGVSQGVLTDNTSVLV